jgi:hypothetical protein
MKSRERGDDQVAAFEDETKGHASCMTFVISGGVDGTRTRGLRRDRPAL